MNDNDHERTRLEDRVARARRRLDQCTAILAEHRQRAVAAQETGVRVGETLALLKIFEDSHRQFTDDHARAQALLVALDGKRA